MKRNTIILLHGFNSAPGNKAKVIEQYLDQHQLQNEFSLIAPQLNVEPSKAIHQINDIINQYRQEKFKVYIIGTSLGGFYANYFRSKFFDDNIIVHPINPSWNPSQTLAQNIGQEIVNFKTNEKWVFKETYIDQLIDFECHVKDNLKNYKGKNYSLHLAKNDELLDFSQLFDYLNQYQVPYELYYYDTNHRFERMEDVLRVLLQQ